MGIEPTPVRRNRSTAKSMVEIYFILFSEASSVAVQNLSEHAGLRAQSRGYSSASTSSAFSASDAIPVIASPGAVPISFTPCVERPITETSFMAIRIILPMLVVIISSSESTTLAIPTTAPFFSVTLILIMPLPPRPCDL